MGLLVIATVIVLINYVVKLVGNDEVAAIFYKAYLYVFSNQDYKQLHASKVELRKIYQERLGISAQDQYAKWTKLNRKHDKLKAEIDMQEKVMVARQQALVSKMKWLVTAFTFAPIWYFRILHRKEPLVYFPKGLLPWVLSYWLSFPSIETGAIGIAGWVFILNKVIGAVEFIVTTLYLSEPFPSEEKPVAETKPETKLETKPVKAD